MDGARGGHGADRRRGARRQERLLSRNGAWLEALRAELDAADSPRTFFFRDDDAGWADGRLLALLDVFAHAAVPLDVAVIPAALDARLATTLRRRPETESGLLAFHQHGLSHANHEPLGRPCEFGPARTADAQRRDIAAGARRLRELLGETAPIFTPPWNRCTETTGRFLVELGFPLLVRDSSAAPFELDGLRELQVCVDWARPDRDARLVAAVQGDRPTGVMLHHALLGPDELRGLARLLALLASHPSARCVHLSALAVGEASVLT